ncbi:hypothetical protein JM93_00147 [Roseibium hamelinense]|uniref:DUF6898 domain-containing protein n=1 Tax=Roseibium hamelinense TaxID=150831 RepID=A0A562TGE0_9HYPH|nr:serine hydroxymethyltransferase [Roseibium hamelinense]MTI42400.1 serine hydroxymethyltransferase [Roseibium hamelinense]TWI92605.1 hypothetical protein JM93_00147 [Roseibium hamelinense]
MSSNTPRAGEVYFEFQQVGQQIRVAAIDGATGIEVVVFGPQQAPQRDLEQIALRKLQRRLQREKSDVDPFRKQDGRGFGTF